MAFTRTILTEKQSYNQADRNQADVVYAKWLELEPRCNKGRDEVLRLRKDGPMVRYDGTLLDSGSWLQIAFLNKSNNSLRLVAVATNLTNKIDAARLVARGIRDALQVVDIVYFYKLDSDDSGAPSWTDLLVKVFNNLDVAFPNFFQTDVIPLPNGTLWRVRLA